MSSVEAFLELPQKHCQNEILSKEAKRGTIEESMLFD